MRIDLAVFDLDGTLLNDKSELTPASIQSLAALSESGTEICLASGRHSSMMDIFTGQLKTCDYLISSNGAVVKDMKGRVIYGAFLDPQEAETIIEFCRRLQFEMVAYRSDDLFFSTESQRISKRFEIYESQQAKLIGRSGLDKYPINQLNHYQDIEKIAVYNVKADFREKVSQWCGELKRTSFEPTGDNLMAFVAKSVNKGNALRRLMEDKGLNPEQVAVFGDFENDISLFEVAGNCIAMGNADPRLKAAATYITLDNNSDGVAYAINRLFLK